MESKVNTIAPNAPEQTTRRVAAYCRVSSSSDDQLHSFAAQVQYYTALIGENEQMELADVYKRQAWDADANRRPFVMEWSEGE